jgi:hypothetical protein
MWLSVEVRRLPSALGREFFRARVSSYHVATFEDTVIFVHDMERTIRRLDPFSQKLIAKIVLQEYTQAETACLLGCSLRNIERFYVEALDRLSEELLRGGLLRPIPGLTPLASQKSCREARIDENFVSCCNEGKNVFLKSWPVTPLQNAILDLESEKRELTRKGALRSAPFLFYAESGRLPCETPTVRGS